MPSAFAPQRWQQGCSAAGHTLLLEARRLPISRVAAGLLAAGESVPGVLPVDGPAHEQVVAGRPEHQVVRLVVLQRLQQHAADFDDACMRYGSCMATTRSLSGMRPHSI